MGHYTAHTECAGRSAERRSFGVPAVLLVAEDGHRDILHTRFVVRQELLVPLVIGPQQDDLLRLRVHGRAQLVDLALQLRQRREPERLDARPPSAPAPEQRDTDGTFYANATCPAASRSVRRAFAWQCTQGA